MTIQDNHVFVLIEIHANEGRETEARETLLQAIATSDKPGMVSSREFADLRDPGAFYAMQEWQSVSSFEAHMRDARANGMDEAIQVLSEAPRTSLLRVLD